MYRSGLICENNNYLNHIHTEIRIGQLFISCFISVNNDRAL